MKQNQIDFLNKIAPAAVEDWNKNHIVIPSITIAQALRESGWGTSILAVKANNLFGIKADKRWKGRVFNKVSGEYSQGSTTEYQKASDFRAYDNWGQGVNDHSAFLSKPRYAAAKGQTNFTIACNYIKKAGYATGPNYATNLVRDIIDFKLFIYDPIQPDFNEILRVQIGAYANKDNALNAANKLIAAGFKYCILYDNETKLYYVQTGAYRDKVTASTVFANLLLKGFQPIMKVKK